MFGYDVDGLHLFLAILLLISSVLGARFAHLHTDAIKALEVQRMKEAVQLSDNIRP